MPVHKNSDERKTGERHFFLPPFLPSFFPFSLAFNGDPFVNTFWYFLLLIWSHICQSLDSRFLWFPRYMRTDHKIDP